MEREDEHSPNGMPLCRFPEPVYATPSVSYNRFGGVRHGFNTGSNRTQPYPPVPSLVPCFRCLPPLRLISNDPDPDDRSWVVSKL
jgi:hypothetical protein